MRFCKMHGAGTDFVIISDMEGALPDASLSPLAKKICARRTGLGADGMMVLRAAKHGGDFRMLFYNADGTSGEMCGNGARCVARYGYEHGLSGEQQRIETTAGLVTGERLDRSRYRIRLNDPSVLELCRDAAACGSVWHCGYVELGDPGIPHALLEVDNWDEMDEEALRQLGCQLRHAAAFPKGANVTFWKEIAPGRLKVRTYERGVEDFTLACGTGCGSLAALLALSGRSQDQLTLECPGGMLEVELHVVGEQIRDIYLTGPTCVVAEGEFVE